MKTGGSAKLFWVLTLLPLILTMLVFNFLPDQIPAHYGINGQVDRWGSKWETLIIPFVSILSGLLIKLWFDRLLPTDKDKTNANALDKMLVMMPIVFLILTILFLLIALRAVEDLTAFPFYKILVVAMGLMFSLVGHYLPQLKQNPLMGIRTKWTLENAEVWRKTHRLGGLVWAIGGIAISFTSLLFSDSNSMYILIGGMLILVSIPIIFSYIYYKELNR